MNFSQYVLERLFLLGGWVRNNENKAQLRPAAAGALPKLGNMQT